MSRDFWNERYQSADELYSNQPNKFLKDCLTAKGKGTVILPGDGDGRNGLWLARQGFAADAFDYSSTAVVKAMQSAAKDNLSYFSSCTSAEEWEPKPAFYDHAAIVFLHLPHVSMQNLLEKVLLSLKKEGTLCIEVFSKDQLGYTSGGPKDPALLYTVETFAWLGRRFKGYELLQVETFLTEGPLHTGQASVINFAGQMLW